MRAQPIKDNYRKAVTAVLLENQERFMREERGMLNEAGGSAGNAAGAIGGNALSGSGLTTQTGGLAGFDPVMISFIRRAMPNLVAYDICGVQPMSGPTGLTFAMKSHYEGRDGAEALYNEPTATSLQVSMLLQTHTTLLTQLRVATWSPQRFWHLRSRRQLNGERRC